MEKDEEKLLSRKRLEKWGRLLIAFLVFLWLCTIISKSIYAAGLTRVDVQTPEKKYIEHIVETDGIVTAGGELAVNTLAGLRILRVKVSEGDWVEKGDVLFTIDLDDLASSISAKEAELTKQQYQLADLQFNAVLDAQKKEVALLWAQEDYDAADMETAAALDRASKALQEARDNLNRHLQTPAPLTSDSDRENAWNSYNSWKSRYHELSDRVAAKEREVKELEEDLAELDTKAPEPPETEENTTENETANDTGDTVEDAEDTEDTAGDEDIHKKNELTEALEKARQELASLRSELASHERNSVSQPDYSAEESAYDNWQQTKSTLEDAVANAKQTVEDANFTRHITLRQKAREIANAAVTDAADSTASIYQLEIARLQGELEKLYEIKKQNGEVKAENAGFISGILITAGGRTADTAAMLLTDTEAPCLFKFSITKEQGKYLHLGDSLTLKIDGGKEIEATVDYLEENTSGNYEILCRLPEGTGAPGAAGTAHKAVQGELHSLTIPTEALHAEQQVFYIYTYNERAGILGNEAYAEKIRVQVEDMNDRYAALEPGTVSEDTQIIVFSSKALEQGEVIRLR